MTPDSGDVLLVDLGIATRGHEQAGTRPAIFLYAEGSVSLIIPLSSNTARLRFRGTVLITSDKTNGLAKPSVALIYQMRALDTHRILKRIGSLSAKDRRLMNKVIRSVTVIK